MGLAGAGLPGESWELCRIGIYPLHDQYFIFFYHFNYVFPKLCCCLSKFAQQKEANLGCALFPEPSGAAVAQHLPQEGC